ncbi:MAG: cytidylate kinase-like family protein [Eubacterium sp.]|jgi:cytidylate kinase|nr:cytidylate kinase-like family protein [Eubacterium sp.]
MKQIIIAIGREFGSGGHIIAQKLAEHYNIPLYHKELLSQVAKDGGYSEEMIERYDERPISLSFMPMPIVGSAISIEQDVAIKQFEFLRKKANEEKESFVVVGRCADEILADNENMTSVFVTSDKESKMKRVMEREGIDEKAALSKMKKMDKVRKTYHNFYCENKWGDSRGYDLCIRTGNIPLEKVTDVIIKYVDAKNN